MATSRHLTLTADEEEILELGVNAGRIEVLSRDGAAEVYFTTDGSTATVGGANCHVLPAAIGSVEVADEVHGLAEVHLISEGTPAVSVRAWK